MKLISSAAVLLAFCFALTSSFGGNRKPNFKELTFDDGPADGTFRTLYIQEGAVVDIICKQNLGFYQGYQDYFDVAWNLGPMYQPERYPIDHDVFPAEKNAEHYHSILTGAESSYNKVVYADVVAKLLSTLRYTARMEDNGKWITCRAEDTQLSDAFFVSSSFDGAYVELVVRPAPAPLTYRSTVVHKWRGGFIGEIDIPISDYYTSWKIIMKFPKKVFSLSGGEFQVANEPCLHEANCGDDTKETWVIYNTFANRVLNPGDNLKFTFIAEIWKKNDQGLRAEVEFYGFDQVFHANYEPNYPSSSDTHVN